MIVAQSKWKAGDSMVYQTDTACASRSEATRRAGRGEVKEVQRWEVSDTEPGRSEDTRRRTMASRDREVQRWEVSVVRLSNVDAVQHHAVHGVPGLKVRQRVEDAASGGDSRSCCLMLSSKQ